MDKENLSEWILVHKKRDNSFDLLENMSTISKELLKTKNSIDPNIHIRPLGNFQQCEREKLFSIPKSDFYPVHFNWVTLNFE